MFEEQTGYIMSRHSKDVQGGLEITFYIKTESETVRVIPERQSSSFFTNAPLDYFPNEIRDVEVLECGLRDFNNDATLMVRSRSLLLQQQMIAFIQKGEYLVYEEDVKPHDRYLMERNIRGAVRFIGKRDGNTFTEAKLISGDFTPDWKVWSLDIETSVSRNELLSVGIVSQNNKIAFVVSDTVQDVPNTYFFPDEQRLLLALIKFFKRHNPDIIIGWNVIGFDLLFLDKRCKLLGIKPAFGALGEAWSIRSVEGKGKYFATIPGRVVLDGITLLKVGGFHFDSYSLNSVSKSLLDDGKLIHGGDRWQEIERLHSEEMDKFVAYNLQDCELVKRIFEKLDLIELQKTRIDLTGIPLEQTGGSVAAFENLYLPRLHKAGWVAPAWRDEPFVPSPGGFVMSSVPGLYKNVLVFDFKSLYPSIIRTFYIDPLARAVASHLAGKDLSNVNSDVDQEGVEDHVDDDCPVPGYLGASYDRSVAILPALVSELAQARENAKRDGNEILSYAIKIIMNSFYGVLGSNVCRFYHAELASSITMRGHELLNRSKKWMEEKGAKVIYGDTDSLFVTLSCPDEEVHERGNELCGLINEGLKDWCKEFAGLESYLELEFETLYTRFYMPTIRGQEEGSKKRYAGITNGEMVFKGLEAARSDWTPLAKRFQKELFELVFHDQDPREYIQTFVSDLTTGKLDAEIIYTKQLSRPISQYSKTIPPHVRAAMMIDSKREELNQPLEYNQGRKFVSFYYQHSGVTPFESGDAISNVDYDHYIEKQITPIADSVLPFFGLSVTKILTKQIELL
ncbi:DNA polymerase II [Marinomonas balearica]|uniref:DNA polymerase n=1 Tax=Marinomonas balearica TaxID=491947 RepID=A0A4V3CG87_9GAMM|nr:DNA polymerase II [Marinomonas balearica]TDO96782.1 DNA polymerase-2 [Marinomonas balearica]